MLSPKEQNIEYRGRMRVQRLMVMKFVLVAMVYRP
jgi:hypothetical protein